MTLTPVDSSMLLAVGYDDKAKELEALFSSGEVWRYVEVPRKVYQELLESEFEGIYMRTLVIDVYRDYRLRRR